VEDDLALEMPKENLIANNFIPDKFGQSQRINLKQFNSEVEPRGRGGSMNVDN